MLECFILCQFTNLLYILGFKEHSCIILTFNDILYNKKAYGGPQQYIPRQCLTCEIVGTSRHNILQSLIGGNVNQQMIAGS